MRTCNHNSSIWDDYLLKTINMNESNRDVLRRYHEDLSKDIIVTEALLGELYQVDVFPKDMIEIIRSQPTPSDKIQKLLELLPKRGPDAFDKFINVIEGSYPWLATVLTSAKVEAPTKTRERVTKTPGIGGNSKGLSRSSLNLDDQRWDLVDGDIKRIVAAFVHRQFGQSKRVSEKDKKSVERFMADQIQRERTRYQSILASTSSTPSSRPTSSLDDNVFRSAEVQENLFTMHLKLEKYIIKQANTTSDDVKTRHSQDDDGHPDHKHHRPQDAPTSTEVYHPPQLRSEDMDFSLVNKEVDIVMKQVDMLEDVITDCKNYFDSRDHHRPLPALLQNLVARLEYQDKEMDEDRNQIKHLLDQVHNQAEYIEKLEKERLEHRKQIQAAYLDMASLRQEKSGLQEKVAKLERERRQHQQEDAHRMKLGIVSKPAKTTPRNGQPTTYGYVGGRMYNPVTGASTDLVNSNVGGVPKKVQRPGNAYLGYAKRYPQAGRYANVSAKKRGKTDYSPTNNFNSTAKF